jgi:hypothetical protein
VRWNQNIPPGVVKSLESSFVSVWPARSSGIVFNKLLDKLETMFYYCLAASSPHLDNFISPGRRPPFPQSDYVPHRGNIWAGVGREYSFLFRSAERISLFIPQICHLSARFSFPHHIFGVNCSFLIRFFE